MSGGALGRTTRSLRVRNFRLYFAGIAISHAGTWMQLIALTVVILQLTDDGMAIGLIGAAQFAPIVLFGPWAGVLSDRMDRWRLLMVTQACGLIVTCVLAILVISGWTPLVAVYALAFLVGTAFAVDNPARLAFIADIIDQEDITNAVGLNSAMLKTSKVVGPALAGVLIAGPGVEWCFVLNALSFVVMMALFLRIDRTSLHRSQAVVRGPGQVREGLAYAWRRQELRAPLLVVAGVGSLTLNFQVVLPLFAVRDLGGTETTFAVLFAVMSAGALFGALAVASRGVADANLLALAAGGMALSTFALALAPNTVIAVVLMVPVGAFGVAIVSSCVALMQTQADPLMRGRMMALIAAVFFATAPVGGPIIGTLAEHLGARTALVVSGVAAAWAAVYVRRRSGSRATEPTTEQGVLAEPAPAPGR